MLHIVGNHHCMQFKGKHMIQTQVNGDLGLIYAHGTQIWAGIFFSKLWLCQSLDIMVRYHYVKYQKKLKAQSWENCDRWTDARTDGQTDWQMNKSEFIRSCQTDIKCPTCKWKNFCLVKWALFEQHLI